MKLFRVISGKHLHFPPQIAEGNDSLWLGPGGVADLSDPFVAKCVEGQEYKLEAIQDAKGVVPTPVENQRFNVLRDAYMRAGEPPKPPAAPGPEPEGADAIPRPDIRPTAGKEKRRDASSSQVPSGDPR